MPDPSFRGRTIGSSEKNEYERGGERQTLLELHPQSIKRLHCQRAFYEHPVKHLLYLYIYV